MTSLPLAFLERLETSTAGFCPPQKKKTPYPKWAATQLQGSWNLKVSCPNKPVTRVAVTLVYLKSDKTTATYQLNYVTEKGSTGMGSLDHLPLTPK